MDLPESLRYTRDHEWVRAEDGEAVVGITAYAAEELGDVVFVELPEIGRKLTRDETFGVIESVKTASDLFAPVAGEVVAINDALGDDPELVNSEPYEGGWMVRLRLDDPAAADALMDAAAYRESVGG
ncbi:MAG: glycine cleavage system protein GcvH [Planctomycetota bacterium]|nr:MAG: glycine cleavage system protein GcvH [Planctomycetota bacterium]